MGRVVIKLSTQPDADPRQVLDILRSCAKAQSGLLASPEPLVTLDNITQGSLDFTVRAYVPNLTRGLGIQSDLRVAMLEALRAGSVPMHAGMLPVPPAAPSPGTPPPAKS